MNTFLICVRFFIAKKGHSQLNSCAHAETKNGPSQIQCCKKRITNLPDRYMHSSTMHVMKPFKTTLLIPLLISSQHHLLNTLEAIINQKSNPAVHRLTLSSLFQSEYESMTDFVFRLKFILPDCEFSCAGCPKDLQPIHFKGQLIWDFTTKKYKLIFQPDQSSYTTRRHH